MGDDDVSTEASLAIVRDDADEMATVGNDGQWE